jgi:hypothetical protein
VKKLETTMMTSGGQDLMGLLATKKALLDMPVKTIFVPIGDAGDQPALVVTINDVAFKVPRGQDVEMPEEVYNIIVCRLKAEGRLRNESERQLQRLGEGFV